jgi:hypothetical protein
MVSNKNIKDLRKEFVDLEVSLEKSMNEILSVDDEKLKEFEDLVNKHFFVG